MKWMRKLKERAGFTLAEMLLATLILLLGSSIVVAGIPAAKNAYEKVVLGSNAQILLSTTAAALRDELGTAWDVKAGEGELRYFSADTGTVSRLYIENNMIMLQEYAGLEDIDGNKTGRVRPLISEAAATSDLYVTYGSVSYDGQNGIVKFSDLKVCRSSNDAVIAGMGDESNGSLAIRVFSVVPE